MARAGSNSKYPWGIEIDSSKTKCNCIDEIEVKLKVGETHRCINKEHILKGTEKVGPYPPNAFGVYDTAGNVPNGQKTAGMRTIRRHQAMAVHGRAKAIV